MTLLLVLRRQVMIRRVISYITRRGFHIVLLLLLLLRLIQRQMHIRRILFIGSVIPTPVDYGKYDVGKNQQSTDASVNTNAHYCACG